MKRKKSTPIAIGCVVLCLVVLRETGVLDVNVYRSEMSASHSTTKSQVHSGDEKHFSFHLTMKRGNETLYTHSYSHNNLVPIEIEAMQEEPVYSGNCAMPLAKSFGLTYRCTFATVKSPTGHEVNGEIEGEVTAKIVGFCTRKKAKELAFKEAEKQIRGYFQKQLNL